MKVPAAFRLLPMLALLLAAGGSPGADPPKKDAAFGTGKASGPLLTREQLRACLAQQAHMKQQEDESRKRQAELVEVKAEIARSGDALKAKLESMDRTNAEAVAAYNAEAAARDKQIDDYEAGVAEFNARVETQQAERDAFAKGCDNRRYFEEDEIAIRKGK